jgi:hypothetical protein
LKKISIVIALVVIALSACGAPAPTAAVIPPTTVPPTAVPPTAVPPTAVPSTATMEPCAEPDQIIFESINNSNEEMTFFWVDFELNETPYGSAMPGERFGTCTFETHIWVVRNSKGEFITLHNVTADAHQRVDISQEMADNAEAGSAVAVPVEEKLKADLDMYKSNGYIPSTDGTFIPRDDIYGDLVAEGSDSVIRIFEPKEKMLALRNFVYSAHFKWSTAAEPARDAQNGCGVSFGYQESSNNSFAVHLNSFKISFSAFQPDGYSYKSDEVGVTSGTGSLNFGNPAEADFSLIVYEYKSYVFVNNELIGEYDLPAESAIEGGFSQGAMISSITEGYGFHCEISNAGVWALK